MLGVGLDALAPVRWTSHIVQLPRGQAADSGCGVWLLLTSSLWLTYLLSLSLSLALQNRDISCYLNRVNFMGIIWFDL